MAEKMVTVTVAKRRSIQHRLVKNGPSVVYGPGQTLEVPERDLERLYKQGFIVDPHEKELTQEQIDAASAAHAVGGQADVKVSEDAQQSIKPGKASRNAA